MCTTVGLSEHDILLRCIRAVATGPTGPIFHQNAPFEMSSFEIFVGMPPDPLDNPTPTHRSYQYLVATALCIGMRESDDKI